MSVFKPNIKDLIKQSSKFSQFHYSFDILNKNLDLIAPSHSDCFSYIVTSPKPQEGKTTIVAQLGIHMAMAQKKVLVIDADMRRPTLHDICGVSNLPGLVEILQGEATPSEAIHKIDFDFNGDSYHFDFIPSGEASPAELQKRFDTAKIRLLFENCKKTYSAVIVDTPPVLAAQDAQFLGPLVDGVLMVINPGQTYFEEAQSTKQRLNESGSKIIGAVMNRFRENIHGRSLLPFHNYYNFTN